MSAFHREPHLSAAFPLRESEAPPIPGALQSLPFDFSQYRERAISAAQKGHFGSMNEALRAYAAHPFLIDDFGSGIHVPDQKRRPAGSASRRRNISTPWQSSALQGSSSFTTASTTAQYQTPRVLTRPSPTPTRPRNSDTAAPATEAKRRHPSPGEAVCGSRGIDTSHTGTGGTTPVVERTRPTRMGAPRWR